jgi:hypothetical protein
MSKRSLIVLATAFVLSFSVSLPVAAKTCKDEYVSGEAFKITHTGSESRAKRAWRAWAKINYGSAWDTWSRAANKTVDCHTERVGWTCIARARPCRR